MKQNTNILIITSFLTLACGQLQGLTKKQFRQLDQLRRELDKRFEEDIPNVEGYDWLITNEKIIEQMRQLDRPTAAVYQEQQNMFMQEVKVEEFEEGEYEISEDLKKTLAQFEGLYEPVEAEITAQQNRIKQYSTVNFSKAYENIEKMKEQLAIIGIDLAQENIPGGVDKFLQASQEGMDALEKRLADAVFGNLVKLADPIIEELGTMKDHIEELSKSSNPFKFDENLIMTSIKDKIIPRLDAIFQQGLLTKLFFKDLVAENVWEDVSGKAQTIVESVNKFFEKLYKYTDHLISLASSAKERSELKKSKFNITVEAILIMQNVLQDLYPKLKDVFDKSGLLLLEEITFPEESEIISPLKKDLYIAYEAKESSKKDKICVLDHKLLWGALFDVTEDKLSRTSPFLDEIKDILEETENKWESQ